MEFSAMNIKPTKAAGRLANVVANPKLRSGVRACLRRLASGLKVPPSTQSRR
jgi:hypothetical protein